MYNSVFNFIPNLLEESSLQHIKQINLFECTEHYRPEFPLYISHNEMHIKYQKDLVMSETLARITKMASDIYGGQLEIHKCWFNLVNRNSKSLGYADLHNHQDFVKLIGLYYIDGCKGNGTLFKPGKNPFQLLAEDNSLVIFPNGMLHGIPDWHGSTRYSMAIDFKESGFIPTT